MTKDSIGSALILAGIFVAGAVGFGGLAYWGFVNLNVTVAVIGCIAEAAWFWAGKHILG